MGKNKIDAYECRQYFQHSTLTFIDQDALDRGRKKQGEIAAELAKMWYQKATELGNKSIQDYFCHKFKNVPLDRQADTQALGRLRRDYFNVIKNRVQKKEIFNIFFEDRLRADNKKEKYDVSLERDRSVELWLERNGNGYDLYISGNGGVEAPEDSSYLFYGYENVKKILFGEGFKTENVKDFSAMFWKCEYLEELDIRKFYTNNAQNMRLMFGECRHLEKIDMQNFRTKNVKDFAFMFYNCNSLKELKLNNFDTSNTDNMRGMFDSCKQLKELDLTNFDTSNVKDMGGTFARCRQLEKLSIDNFNTMNVKDMSYMFYNCMQLKKLDVSNFNMRNVESMSYMFSGCQYQMGFQGIENLKS